MLNRNLEEERNKNILYLNEIVKEEYKGLYKAEEIVTDLYLDNGEFFLGNFEQASKSAKDFVRLLNAIKKEKDCAVNLYIQTCKKLGKYIEMDENNAFSFVASCAMLEDIQSKMEEESKNIKKIK